MKTRIQWALVPFVMLLALNGARCRRQDLPVLGQGNLSCTSWTERRAGDAVDAATMIAWALGYMTAYNQYGAEPKRDVSGGQHTEELAKWIDDYSGRDVSGRHGSLGAWRSGFPQLSSFNLMERRRRWWRSQRSNYTTRSRSQ